MERDEQERAEPTRRKKRRRLLEVAAVVLGVVMIALYLARKPILAALATGPVYRASFTTVAGLRRGDQVRYGGIPVGRVRSVRIDRADPARIVVTFRVNPDTPMRTDTRASIVDVTTSVTRYLSLRPGSRAAPPLPPGREVATTTSPTLEETLTRATVLLARVDTALDVAAPLLSGDFFGRLDRMTRRLDLMTGALLRSSGQWAPSLERAAGRLDTVVDRTARLLATVDSASPDLPAAAAEARAMLRDTRVLLTELRADLSRLAARLQRPATLIRHQPPMPKTAGPSPHD